MTRILFLLVGFSLTACSSLPPQTQAIHTALTTNLALRSAADQCSAVDTNTQRIATEQYAQWWQRNQQWVQAADYGLLKMNWEASQKATQEQHAVIGMQMLEMLHYDSELQKTEWLGQQADEKKCSELFSLVESGKIDLARKDQDSNVLETLYQERQNISEDANAARSINARYRKYGRSYYLAEKALKASGCSQPSISMLRNSWPLEVYDSVCSEDDYLLVKCLWGRCEVKR